MELTTDRSKNELVNINKPSYLSWAIPVHSVIVFLFASILTAVVIDVVPLSSWTTDVGVVQTKGLTRSYAIYVKSSKDDHLKHVINVLESLGYDRVDFNDKWDLLWAHDYPFIKMPQKMKNLEKHQVVNHFPGCGFLTNKVDLSTTRLPFLPRAFRLPSQKNEFLEYYQRNPSALFVEKHNEHRNIVIRSPDEINLDTNGTFVQEYIQDPFLVDGYKFDIGVYVVITSFDPLRVYIYTGDVLFRYCPEKYHPFNSSNVDKYVVGDDYLPTWSVPSLKKFYNLGGNMRTSFDAYVRDQQMDPSNVWTQIEEILRLTILAKEKDIVNILKSYKTRNFFDLMRFDFIVDKTLKVYLMEANMSPNLSSAHFKSNSILYEQLLYSVMNLVGIGSPVKSFPPDNQRSDDVYEMITSEQNLATNLNSCTSLGCDRSCKMPECDLCIACLSGSEYEVLTKAHREHLHKVNMKRIYPRPILNLTGTDINFEVQNMTERNAWMTRWFYYKCLYDNSWCH